MSSKLESTIEEYVIDQLFNGAVSVNGKTKKPKFAKDGSVDFSKASYVSLTGDAVFFALGNANVTAYYWNEKLDTTVAKTVAAGTVNNWGQAATSLTFARKAVTKKVYATGVDVTLFDTTGGDIFAGAYNKYDKKNANAALSKTEGDVEITILNSTVKNVYAGGEGDDVYYGDVTVNVSNSKVGKIYAGGKTGAYTIGDLTVNITNDGNQMNGAAGYVFSGAIFGTPADKKSQSIGKTYVNVDNYNGAFKGALNYVEKVSVTGDSNVVFNGNFKEVDTISVVGGAIAEIKKGGAYEYEFVLNGDTVGNNNTAMLTLAKKLNPKKISIVVNNDFAHNGSVNLINWAGYVPSKKNVVILPNPTVKNERGGIIADYMYSYDFDAANQLIFTYTGEAYVLVANDYTFGLADDVVLMSGMYDYTDKIVDLKGGLNSIDLGDSTRQGKEFKLTVTEASENVVNAEDFAADVVISDRQSKGKNVVIAGTATGDVDFNKSAEAVLEVTGDFDGNVDFTSVKGSAQVKLDNNASINAGSIESGENLVEVVVDAYSEATVKDLDFDAYLSGAAAGEYGDFLLNIGDNAVVSNGNDELLVNNYNRNEVVENSDVTLYVMGEVSGNTLVKGDAEFSVKNYGEVSGDINASYLYDIDGNKINRKDASVKFQNHGVFSGSINMDEQNGNDVFANASVLGSVTGNATVTADAEINFGGGKDKLQFFGNNTFEGNVTKLETSKLEMEFKKGVTDYNGTISYTQAFDAAPENGVVDGRYPAESDKFTGYDNTKITVTDAIVNVADGKELIANEIVVDNGKINGDFDFKKLTLANGTFVLDENMSFDGYDGEGATLEIGDNVNLYAQDLTLGTITTGNNAYLNTKDLTATMGDIAIDGAADVDGDATAAKNVELTGTEFNVTGTVAAGEDVIVDADKLTAGAITAGENVGVLADTLVSGAITAGENVYVEAVTVVSGAITADGNVKVDSENAAVTGNVTAANVEIYGNAVIDGNVNATEEDVVLDADDAIVVTGDVTAQGIIDIDGTVSASDIEAVGAVTADGKLTADNVTGSNVEINGEAVVAGAITATEANVTLDGVISAAAVNAVKGDVTATMDVRNTMNLDEITAANVALTAANAFAENLTSTKVDDEAADIIKVGNITAKAVEDNPDTIGVDESKAGDVTFDGNGIINAKDIIADGAFNSTIADLTADSIDAGSVAIDGVAKVADITADTFVDLDNDVTAAAITAGGAFTADGKLTADSIDAGSVAINGTADVNGDVTATAGNVAVTGTADVKGDVTATAGDVAVTGTAVVDGDITAGGKVTAEGKLTADNVTGSSVTLRTDINVENVKATEGNVFIASYNVDSVVADVTADKGNVILSANLDDASLTAGAVTADAKVTVQGKGTVTVADVNATDVEITDAKTVAGKITAKNDVTVTTDDVATGAITAGGDVEITSANAVVDGVIDAEGTVKAESKLQVGAVNGASVVLRGELKAGNITAEKGKAIIIAQADSTVGDVNAATDAELSATVNKSLTAGAVDAAVNANLKGDGDVEVTDVNAGEMVNLAAATVKADAITAGKDVTISSADASVKSVDAKRDVIITGEAEVEGDVLAGAMIDIDSKEFVAKGTVSAGTDVDINADKVTAGMIGAEGAVVINSADAKVDTSVTGASVAINGNATVTSEIIANKGDVELDGVIKTGVVNAAKNVTAAGELIAASVTGGANVDLNDLANISGAVKAGEALTANGDLIAASLTGGSVNVNGKAKISGDIKAEKGNVDLTGTADVTGNVTATEGNVNVATYDDAAAQNIELGSISAVLGAADINAVDLNDNVLVGAIAAKTVTLSGEGVLKTGAVTAAGEFVSTAKDATIESIDAGNVTITTVGGTKVGNIDSEDSVNLTANNVAAVIIADAVTAKGDVAVNGAGKVTAASVAGNNVNVNGNASIDTVVATKSAVVNGNLEADSVQGADVVVNGTAKVTGAVSAVENLVTVNVDGVLNAGSISGKTGVIVAGVADVTAGVASAEGDIIVDGKLAAAGTVEALNGAVGVNGSMQAGAVNADSVKVAGTAKVTGAVTATKDVVVVGGTLNADSIDAENVDVKGVVTAKAITATGKVALATNDDAVADTIKVGSIDAKGDVVLTAYANDKIEVGDLAGNNVYFNGKGAVVFLGDVTLGGNVTAKGDLAITVDNVEFNGKVTAKTLNITEGQTFTFNAGAEIDTVTVKNKALAADAAINIKNADAIFLNVAVEADAALALELNGQNLTGAATLASDAKITVANGNFVGTITETGVNATVALKDATVSEVIFAGSNIDVENSGIVENLTIVNTLNITGVTGKDEFTVKSDIDAAAAYININNAVTYFQDVTAKDVAVNNGAFNALSFAGSATGNGAVAIENWDDASGANSLNVGSIDITAQKDVITGAMTATNGGIKVAGAKVAGNVTANRTEDGESVVDFAVADAYAGTIAATATAGAINMNIAGDLSGAAVNLDGAGVTLTTDSSFVAWNEGKTEIAANSNVVLANDANMNVNGDYVGNLNGGNIAIDGKFFGAYVGNEIVKATADVNSLTVNGNDAYGNTADAFANAVFASSNKDAAAEVVKAINAKYQAGFVYADVTANGDVTVNQAMTGAVTAGGKFTVGAYETKMDSIVYVDPSDVDAFKKVATVVDNLNVDSLDAASVKGQTVYYVNQDYKDNANPEHNDVRLVVTVINGVNVTVTGENAAVSGDFYGNMTAEKAAVVMNGNILGGWAHTEGKGNWMLPDTDPSYQAEDVYEKATIVAGSFESTAEGKKIYADITAKVADINVVSDVEGNLTAEVGSVIAGNNVNGNVEAGKDVNIINGTVDGYVDADGDVNVLNVTGTVDGNNINSKGTIGGKVTAANNASVNVVNADIVAGNDVTATGVITGNITAGNDVTAEALVDGNINAKGVVNATDVTGYVYTEGNVTANKVDGTVDGYDVTVVTAGGKVTAANDAIVDVAMNGIEAANDATVKVSANGNVTAGNNVFADAAAINGDVTATLGEVKAASVNGSITAGTDVTVTGTVTAPGAVPTAVVAGGTVKIDGQVGKAGEAVDVTAGADAIFGAAVYGNVNAVGYVDAKDVTGDITAGGYVKANDVTGDITAGDYVDANNVTGDITAENNIEANDVVGAVESVNGNITLNSVVGDVTALNGDVTVATTVNSDGYAAVTAQNVTIGGQAGDAINTVDISATESATLGGDVYGSVSAETVTKDGAITKITGDVTASDIALKDVNVEGNVTATEGNVVVGNVGMNLAYTGAGLIAAGNVGGDFSYTADAGVVDNIVVGNVAGSIDVIASIDEEEQAGGITVKVGNVGAADAAADHIYLAGEEKLLHDHEVGALTVNTVLNFTAGEVYVDNFNIDGKSIANITATSIQGATVENVGVDKVYNGVFLNASDCVKLTITGDIRIASATVLNAEFVVDGNVTATETWTWNGVDAYVFDSRVAADVAAKNINISGNAEVSLNAENVTVGGNVIGNITADIADVEGDVTGNVTADVVTVGGNAKGVFVAETIEIGKDFTGDATGKTADATFVANGNFNGTANGFESVTIGGNATLTGDLEADTINFNGTTVVLNGNGNEITAANLNFAADVDLTAGDIDLNGADLTVKNFTANAGVVDAGDITFTGTATVAGDFTGTLIGTDADNTLVLKGAFNGTFDLGEGYDKIDVDTDVTLAGLTGVEVLDIAKDATLTFSSTFELTSALEVSLDAGTDGEDAIVNVTLGADLDKLFIGGADWVWDSVNSRFAVAGATTGDDCLTYDDANDKLTWGTIA